MHVLLLSLTFAADFQVTPTFTVQPAAAPVFIVRPVVLDYLAGHTEALKTGKPLLVWIGQPQSAGDYGNVIHCEAATFPGFSGQGVVVAQRVGDQLLRLADLRGVPVSRQIQEILNATVRRSSGSLRAAEEPSRPFEVRLGSTPAISVLPAAGVSIASAAGRVGATRILVPPVVQSGGTNCRT